MKKMKNICKKSLNGGISWVYPHFDANGALKLSVFPAYEILPEWKDREHEELDFAIRVYEVIQYEGTTEIKVIKVEVYEPDGIYRYILDDFALVPDVAQGDYEPYFTIDNKYSLS